LKLKSLERAELKRFNADLKDASFRANRKIRATASDWIELWAWYAQKVAYQLIWRHFRWGTMGHD
jgi:hypothetical protein